MLGNTHVSTRRLCSAWSSVIQVPTLTPTTSSLVCPPSNEPTDTLFAISQNFMLYLCALEPKITKFIGMLGNFHVSTKRLCSS